MNKQGRLRTADTLLKKTFLFTCRIYRLLGSYVELGEKMRKTAQLCRLISLPQFPYTVMDMFSCSPSTYTPTHNCHSLDFFSVTNPIWCKNDVSCSVK